MRIFEQGMRAMISQTTRRLAIVLLLIVTANCHSSAGEQNDPELSPYAGAAGWQESYDRRVQWFKDAKFGMFIHWGLYSPAGGYWPPGPETGRRYNQHYAEWIRNWARVPEPEYGKTLKPLFTPETGCTDEWAELAKLAGMKYAVLTAKHHEGYTLFNSDAPYSHDNDFTGGTNISPEGRDMFGEYADSMRKFGVKPGFYYSIIDWQHPSAYNLSRPFPVDKNADNSRYVQYMSHHLDELASNYGELALIWIDYSSARWQGSTWRTKRNLTNLLAKQPDIITNNRWWNDLSNRNGDYFSPEKWVPAGNAHDQVFEVCHTMNESFGFSYHDSNWKTGPEVIKLLCEIASKGGNLLLNVGPDRYGRIPQESVDALTEVGRWIDVNGDAIYGTIASPFRYYDFDGCCTMKQGPDGTVLYIHLFSMPKTGEIQLTGLQNKIDSARLLDGSESLDFDSDKKTIQLPKEVESQPVVVVQVDLEGECRVDNDAAANQRPDRSFVMPAMRASLRGPSIRLEQPDQNIGYWLSTDDNATFTFNVDRPETVQHLGGHVERQPGTFELILTVAVENSAGGELVATLDTSPEQTLEAQLDPTGGWREYRDVTVGNVTLSEARKHTLRLEASSVNKGGFVNLKAVRLRPLETVEHHTN